MTELLTLSKADPKFLSYLDGTFSKNERALPVRSLNVRTESEQITFQIRKVKDIERPWFASQWLQILKVRNLLLVAFPIFLILTKDLLQGKLLDPFTAVLSSLGVLFLMTGMSLRNDYLDHLSGLDRVHPQAGSRSIQNGWVTAKQVLLWSYVYFALGFVFGLKALIMYPKVLILLGVLAALGIFGLSSYKLGFKYRRWSEWTAFWLLGPFLVIGVHLSAGAELDAETVALGVFTGWMSVFYLHLKNFDQLMVNEKAQFENTMTWLGYEKGRQWLALWWVGLFLIQLGYHHMYSNLAWKIIFVVFTFAMTVGFIQKLRNLTSPLGSNHRNLFQFGRWMLIGLVILWSARALW